MLMAACNIPISSSPRVSPTVLSGHNIRSAPTNLDLSFRRAGTRCIPVPQLWATSSLQLEVGPEIHQKHHRCCIVCKFHSRVKPFSLCACKVSLKQEASAVQEIISAHKISNETDRKNLLKQTMQFPATTITAILVASATSTSGVPNIIIMQPDDFPVYTGWGAPPNDPFEVNSLATDPPVTLTNIEKLFGEGVKMTQAYIASSACGTSRYATMTGKYPSRSSTGRERAVSDNDAVVKVNIPGSKLLDVPGYGDDCSSDNMAVHLKNYGGYRTGVVGKWHLGDTDASTFDYDILRSDIQGCGFDFAEGLYAEVCIKNRLQRKGPNTSNLTELGQSSDSWWVSGPV